MDSAKPGATPTREERLAAQLRANLRRRKQQARAMGQAAPDDGSAADAASDREPANPALVNRAPDG